MHGSRDPVGLGILGLSLHMLNLIELQIGRVGDVDPKLPKTLFLDRPGSLKPGSAGLQGKISAQFILLCLDS